MRTFTVVNPIAVAVLMVSVAGCNVYHGVQCVTLESDPKVAAWSVEIAVCYDEDNGQCYAFSLRDGSKDEFIGTVPCEDEGEPLIVSR